MIPPAGCAVAGWLLWGGLLDGALLGVLAWAALRLVLIRGVILRHHQRGARLARAGDWEGALRAFQASEAWWLDHPTLDRWRAPLLGAATTWPYGALALYDQAVCLVQLDRPEDALDALRHLDTRWPGMPHARELRGWLLARSPPSPAPDADWFDPDALDAAPSPGGAPP